MGNIDIMNQRQRSILGIVLRSNHDNSRRMEEDAIDVQIVRKLGNDTFTSCQSIIITVTYGPGTLT